MHLWKDHHLYSKYIISEARAEEHSCCLLLLRTQRPQKSMYVSWQDIIGRSYVRKQNPRKHVIAYVPCGDSLE